MLKFKVRLVAKQNNKPLSFLNFTRQSIDESSVSQLGENTVVHFLHLGLQLKTTRRLEDVSNTRMMNTLLQLFYLTVNDFYCIQKTWIHHFEYH